MEVFSKLSIASVRCNDPSKPSAMFLITRGDDAWVRVHEHDSQRYTEVHLPELMRWLTDNPEVSAGPVTDVRPVSDSKPMELFVKDGGQWLAMYDLDQVLCTAMHIGDLFVWLQDNAPEYLIVRKPKQPQQAA